LRNSSASAAKRGHSITIGVSVPIRLRASYRSRACAAFSQSVVFVEKRKRFPSTMRW